MSLTFVVIRFSTNNIIFYATTCMNKLIKMVNFKLGNTEHRAGALSTELRELMESKVI